MKRETFETYYQATIDNLYLQIETAQTQAANTDALKKECENNNNTEVKKISQELKEERIKGNRTVSLRRELNKEKSAKANHKQILKN